MPDDKGHKWELKAWGDWWECKRCGEGCRFAGTPPADLLVFDNLFTCEEMQLDEDAQYALILERSKGKNNG